MLYCSLKFEHSPFFPETLETCSCSQRPRYKQALARIHNVPFVPRIQWNAQLQLQAMQSVQEHELYTISKFACNTLISILPLHPIMLSMLTRDFKTLAFKHLQEQGQAASTLHYLNAHCMQAHL
jgi:hypothetical protein